MERKMREYNAADSPCITLLVEEYKLYRQSIVEILKYYVNEKKVPCIYVTINIPFESIRSMLSGSGVDMKKIVFVDAITRTVGGRTERSEGCIYLNRINDLTDMAVAISNAVQGIPAARRLILLDSVSTLQVYNNDVSVSKFLHFLTGKMRVWNMDCVLMSLKTMKDEAFLSQVSLYCDRRMDVDAGNVQTCSNENILS